MLSWKLSPPSLLSLWSWLIPVSRQDHEILIWINKNCIFPANTHDRKTEYSLEYLRVLLWSRISVFQEFFFPLTKQHCFCIHIFYLFAFCVDVISQLPASIAFFLYGHKSWVFFEWKRMVDTVNSACFSSLEITSKTAYMFFIEKCGFWKA